MRGRHSRDDRQRLVVGDVAGAAATGRCPPAKQPSTFHRFPMPATVRWSSSASPIGRVGSSSRSRRRKRVLVELRREDVRARGRRSAGRSACAPSVISSSTGPSNCTTLASPRADDQPRAPARARPARRLAPITRHAPGHAQVRVDRQAALEAQEQVLAVGVDAAHGAPGQALGPAVAREARVRRARARRARGPRAPAGCGSPRSGSCRLRALHREYGRRVRRCHRRCSTSLPSRPINRSCVAPTSRLSLLGQLQPAEPAVIATLGLGVGSMLQRQIEQRALAPRDAARRGRGRARGPAAARARRPRRRVPARRVRRARRRALRDFAAERGVKRMKVFNGAGRSSTPTTAA